MTSEQRKRILLAIADAIEANAKRINVENEADVSAAQQAGYEKSLISRLALKPGKASKLNPAILDKFFNLFFSVTSHQCLVSVWCQLCIMFLLDHMSLFSKLVSTPTPVSELCFLYLADYKSCKLCSRTCKYGRSNWSCFEKDWGKGGI